MFPTEFAFGNESVKVVVGGIVWKHRTPFGPDDADGKLDERVDGFIQGLRLRQAIRNLQQKGIRLPLSGLWTADLATRGQGFSPKFAATARWFPAAESFLSDE